MAQKEINSFWERKERGVYKLNGMMASTQNLQTKLDRIARLPHLRALTWSGDILYASRGYELLSARCAEQPGFYSWKSVGSFRAPWPRRLSVKSRLTARLFRDGFHTLAVLPSGGLVAAVPGAIVSLRPGETELQATHRISRGTRPLHITSVPDGTVYWGEYFDNPHRDEVHIYGSGDSGTTWSVAHTFPKGAIRHVHNIVHDPWGCCLWILTGDYGDECRILRASCDLRHIETVLRGNQQARAVALVPLQEAVYFSSDTPLEKNFVYRLDRNGNFSMVADISSSSIYACRVADRIFFSTMVEPSEVNRDGNVRVYGGGHGGLSWQPLLAWQKDSWPTRFFQYGNALLPDGENTTSFLAVTTVAVESDDMVTSLFRLSPQDRALP